MIRTHAPLHIEMEREEKKHGCARTSCALRGKATSSFFSAPNAWTNSVHAIALYRFLQQQFVFIIIIRAKAALLSTTTTTATTMCPHTTAVWANCVACFLQMFSNPAGLVALRKSQQMGNSQHFLLFRSAHAFHLPPTPSASFHLALILLRNV